MRAEWNTNAASPFFFTSTIRVFTWKNVHIEGALKMGYWFESVNL